MEIVINLREHREFWEQYLELRNECREWLLSRKVGIEETRKWIIRDDIEIRAIVEKDRLKGVVILYLHKQGEVAFLARERGKGTGTRLLEIIEKVAREKNLEKIWAAVLKDNQPAQMAFARRGFSREGVVEKEYLGMKKKCDQYQKKL